MSDYIIYTIECNDKQINDVFNIKPDVIILMTHIIILNCINLLEIMVVGITGRCLY